MSGRGRAAAPELVVVGLGPGDPGLLTREAAGWLAGGHPVYLRTRVHPTVAALPEAAGWPSFDHLYEDADDFAALYDAIVAALLAAARDAGGPVVYAVPGHPLVGESTVARLRDAARAGDLTLRLVAATRSGRTGSSWTGWSWPRRARPSRSAAAGCRSRRCAPR
jgi:tetrapyrrole methylase family protein / MazG family protein